MDIGTNATYTDPNGNIYAGLVIGHDFTFRSVWRAKLDGAIRFKVDGTVADGPGAPDDTVAQEKVDTHLLNFLGFFRDGTPKLFLLAPSDPGLHAGPAFGTAPVFHPSPAGP
jgi:hypothetical protein